MFDVGLFRSSRHWAGYRRADRRVCLASRRDICNRLGFGSLQWLEPGVTGMGIATLAEIKTLPLIWRCPVDNEYSRTHKHTTDDKSGVKCFV
jgi:hypothetical protein